MVNSISMAVVDGAYQIAATYLKETGRLSAEGDIYDPLLESITNKFNSGRRSKLVLANRAIARFGRTHKVSEAVNEGVAC